MQHGGLSDYSASLTLVKFEARNLPAPALGHWHDSLRRCNRGGRKAQEHDNEEPEMSDHWGSRGWTALLGWLAMLALLMGAVAAHAQDKSKVKATAFNAKDCYECHEAIQDFHEKGHAQERRLRLVPQRAWTRTARPARAGRRPTRTRHLRQLPPEPVPHHVQHEHGQDGAQGKDGRHRWRHRQAADAARLHARAQRAALARLRAVRPGGGRPRVRRPLRQQGRQGRA